MAKFNKFIIAVIGAAATLIFDQYGVDWGLPPDWPETVTAVLTPILVYFVPNQET